MIRPAVKTVAALLLAHRLGFRRRAEAHRRQLEIFTAETQNQTAPSCRTAVLCLHPAQATLCQATRSDQGQHRDSGREPCDFHLRSFRPWPGVCGGAAAHAQVSDDIVRIGVLNDQSGLYADLGGPGSVAAAKMAVEDAGGAVLGKPVEIVFADHQNKSDIGVAIARQWFDVGKVDLAIGFDNSAVALAVEQLAAERTGSRSRARSAAPPLPANHARPTKRPGSMTAMR